MCPPIGGTRLASVSHTPNLRERACLPGDTRVFVSILCKLAGSERA
jgi:hypothetical protein